MNREELKKLSVKELKAKCKELGLTGYSNKKEDELIEMILNAHAQDKVPEVIKNDETGVITDPVTAPIEDEKAVTNAVKRVTFIKLFDGIFGFNGREFKEKEFVLTEEEANHPRIKTALKAGLIKIK